MYNLDIALAYIDANSAKFLKKHGADYPIIIKSLIAAEDHRAERHRGIDYRSMARAAVKLLAGRRFNGISTIEQQLARTIFPRNKRNVVLAKIDELVLSYRIAHNRPKFAIWSSYLMTAYYGAGLNGYAAARANLYQNKEELTDESAASIVSCLKYPRPSNPSSSWLIKHKNRVDYVVARQKVVNKA